MIVVMNKNYTSEDIDQVVNYIENKNLFPKNNVY